MEEKPTIFIDILLADLITLVRGAVIYQDYLNILVRLVDDTVQALPQALFLIIDGKNQGNKRMVDILVGIIRSMII